MLISFDATFDESNPSPFLFCCVTDGVLPNGLELLGVLPLVF